MNEAQRRRVLAAMHDSSTPARLCEVTRQVTGATGAGITLLSGDQCLAAAWTTDAGSALIEELQFMLGEGPGVDAYRCGQPVLEPDLADPATPRWLAFAGLALDAGVRAVFGFPMGVSGTRLGTLDMYMDHPGPLAEEQYARAVLMAAVTAKALIVMQDEAPDCTLTALAGSHFHAVVHQAAGMVAAQHGESAAEAMVRLRAHAFGSGLRLSGLAADIVARRKRMDDRDH